MRVLLDACVLYPTVLREILVAAAKAGFYQPIWSERILQEWSRAVAKNLPDQAEIAGVEIALLQSNWPQAEIEPDPQVFQGLWLPDENDIHVLAAAIGGGANILVTANISDFPTRILANHGILRRDPDGFLYDLWREHPEKIGRICEDVRAKAEHLAGKPMAMRGVLKKARLPRLAKAVTTSSGFAPLSP